MNEFYATLRDKPYEEFKETKGTGTYKADYISWAVMHDILKKTFQYVEYKIHEYKYVDEKGCESIRQYTLAPDGSAMVTVTLTVTDENGDEHQHTECLAIRDYTMKAKHKPSCADLENAIRRCIAKAGSMLTGFAIELWFNEDLKGLDYDLSLIHI